MKGKPIRFGLPALLAAVLACVLTGCAGGGGSPTRFYVIDPIEATPLSSTVVPPTVEILALTLPQYLERFQVATRAGPDRLQFSESHQWGENLRKNLIRTLARNLARLLDSADVGTPQRRSATTPDYRLRVAIDQFERDTTGLVQLAASWQVIDPSGAMPVRSFHTDLDSGQPVAAADYDAIVARMRRLFGELSTAIGQSLLAPLQDLENNQ